MNIFTFWEPKNKIPAYLKLCMKTWEKFIPDAKIHILDFSNIFDYIDIGKYGKELFNGTFSLPQIADAIRAMLLEKYGGIWMDVDTIILKKDIEKYLVPNKDVAFFEYPEKLDTHICWIRANENSNLLNYWVNTNISKINKKIEVDNEFWSYLGNSIVDPYIKEHPDEVEIFDILLEGCMPELKYGTNNPNNYLDYYFRKNYHLSDVDTTLIMLHNSWSPTQFRNMTEEEFIRYDCTISNILCEALEIRCKKDKKYWDAFDGNRCILHKSNGEIEINPEISGLNIIFKGVNSVVDLYEPIGTFKDSNFILGNNCRIVIKESYMNNQKSALNLFVTATNSICTIGENFCCNSISVRLIYEENLNVEIGDNCFFESGVEIRPSNRYMIYDINDNHIINNSGPINIGNHVYIEKNVTIIGGAGISENSVVFSGSIVSENFEDSNLCIGGSPAKVIYKDINWAEK